MSTSTDQNAIFAPEVTTFLRNLHALNKSIGSQLSPMIEAKCGIDMRLYFILHIIRSGTIYPSAIAQAISLPNSLVTKHLDQLAAKGLLERSLDPDDSRRIRVSLTESAKTVLQSADATFGEAVGRRLALIPDGRRSDFLATLVELAQDSSWR